MGKRREARPADLGGDKDADKLDALNAQLRGQRQGPDLIRRRIEAEIDAKARRRRSREAAASSAWKR